MRSRFLFWTFWHSVRLSSFGDSIPMKTESKPALTIRSKRSASSAKFIEASVKNTQPFLSLRHSIRAGSSRVFKYRLFPIKLSSTKKILLRQPVSYIRSSSMITCCADFSRGRWPKRTVTLQKSQLNGHPLENWMLIEAYFFISTRSQTGGGVRLRSQNPDARYIFLRWPLSRSWRKDGNVSSASSRTRWSTSSKASGSAVKSGPPAMTFKPFVLQRAIICLAESRWTAIPPMKTKSAHERSSSVRPSTLTSTRRFWNSSGNMAATVSKPSGGYAAFFRINFKAYLKDQNVSGNFG